VCHSPSNLRAFQLQCKQRLQYLQHRIIPRLGLRLCWPAGQEEIASRKVEQHHRRIWCQVPTMLFVRNGAAGCHPGKLIKEHTDVAVAVCGPAHRWSTQKVMLFLQQPHLRGCSVPGGESSPAGLPQAHCAICTTCGQQLSSPAERHRQDRALVALQGTERLRCAQVPQLNTSTDRACRCSSTIRADGHL
jgi:hypothetical protein